MSAVIYENIKSALKQWSVTRSVMLIGLIFLDLAVKRVLEARLENWPGTVSVFPGFNLTLGHNRGVSFGMLENGHWLMPYFLAILALVLVVVVLIWTAQQKSKFIRAAGVLFAAGGLANAIDRLGDGAVTDYLDFGWQALRWPTFNLADVLIFIGVALLLIGWRIGSQNSDDDAQ